MLANWLARLAGAIVGFACFGVLAHEGADDESAQVGSVHFEMTCEAAAQPAFNHGVAALHSFYFGEAKRSFNATLEADASVVTEK